LGVGKGNSEKVFHADGRRLETQIFADKNTEGRGKKRVIWFIIFVEG